MHRLTDLSLRQRSVIVLLTILIALAGIFGVTRLKMELIPDIEVPILTTVTVVPGAAPETVDQQVSQPITGIVSGLSGVISTQTISSGNFSIVVTEYDYGDDMAARQEELRNAIRSVPLPDNAQELSVERINLQQFPIYQFSLTAGEDADAATLRGIAQAEFLPSLSSADGVSRVEIIGGSDNELQIRLDPAAMAEAGVTTETVMTVLQANNISAPVGAINDEGASVPVRVDGSLTSIESVQGLIIGADGLQPLTLGDIATIEVAPAGSSGIARTNGQPSIALDVYMSQGANTVETAEGVRNALADIEERLDAAGMDVEIIEILDQAVFIEQSIDSLVREAVLGAVFAIVIILLFLLSVRSTLVTAISIPLSMLMAFLLLWWQGISLNVMSLGGLAVAVGRVVDDSIVVLESIYRHVQKGKSPQRAALDGTREVALAITTSTLTSVAVFLPIAFVGGLIGEIFQPFALTVTFAILASLVVSLTIVPVMSSFFITRKTIRPVKPGGDRMANAYEPALKLALRRPFWTLAIATGLMIGSLMLTPFIGVSFLPAMGQPTASVTVEYPQGTTEEDTLAGAAEIEEIIASTVETETIQTQVGGETLTAAISGAAGNRATMTVVFPEDADGPAEIAKLREAMAGVEGPEVTVASLESAASGTSSINVIVQGDDYAEVSRVTQELTEQVTGVENVENVDNDVVGDQPEIRIEVSPQRAAMNGTAAAAIAGQIGSALNGMPAGQVTIDGVPLPVTIMFEGEMTPESLSALPVSPTSDATLENVATIERVDGASQILRQDGVRTATITGAITSDDTGGPIADVQSIINDYEAPEGITISAGGIAQQQEDAFLDMGLAIIVAIAAVYVVMVAGFGSLLTPFVILFSLPLAIIGVLLALLITGKTLGLSALIGLLMLVGIVVTNAIVLLEYVIELRGKGVPLQQAIIEGGKVRLRPILMTALATMLALVPLALSNESGALIAADLAVVVIGGLLTSTLLTLFVVPVIYELLGRWQERRASTRDDDPTDLDDAEIASQAPAEPVGTASGQV
jgi:hydrophobic/amphiphilic exporter-1 (mainly G- bacteria), HAE1 family